MLILYVYDLELQGIVAEVIADTKEFCEEAATNYGYNENITNSKYKWTYERNAENNTTDIKLIDARGYRTEKVEYCIDVVSRVIEHAKGNYKTFSDNDVITLHALDFGYGDDDFTMEDAIQFRDLLSDSTVGAFMRQHVLPEHSLTPQEYLSAVSENTLEEVMAKKAQQQKAPQNNFSSIEEKTGKEKSANVLQSVAKKLWTFIRK